MTKNDCFACNSQNLNNFWTTKVFKAIAYQILATRIQQILRFFDTKKGVHELHPFKWNLNSSERELLHSVCTKVQAWI